MNPPLPALLLDAANFAAQCHAGQLRRDGTTPYINHPIEVAWILAHEAGIDDAAALAAALLHDTLEDTDASPDLLRERFGDHVASIVAEVTDDTSLPKASRKEGQVQRAGSYSPSAALVRCGDQICNLRSLVTAPPSDWSRERKAAYVTWMERVAAAMPPLPDKLASLRREAFLNARETVGPDDGTFSYSDSKE